MLETAKTLPENPEGTAAAATAATAATAAAAGAVGAASFPPLSFLQQSIEKKLQNLLSKSNGKHQKQASGEIFAPAMNVCLVAAIAADDGWPSF